MEHARRCRVVDSSLNYRLPDCQRRCQPQTGGYTQQELFFSWNEEALIFALCEYSCAITESL